MELEDIPAEVRWEIATKSVVSMAAGYGMAFRQIVGEEPVRKVENALWAEAGKSAKSIADSLGLPARNAIEIDEAFGIAMMTVQGKSEWEELEKTEDKVVNRITSCPVLNNHIEMNIPIITMQDLCELYSSCAVQSLNHNYDIKFDKKMCKGDGSCEYAIELKK